jgi:multidrug resistance efflux pump
VKATVKISAILAVLIFAWYLVADRITPYTSNVRVKAMVIDIVPEVSGQVAAVAVNNGQVVERGDLLVRIDPRPFQLKVDRARAALDLATQNVGAGSAAIEVAVAKLAAARINLGNVEAQTMRVLELESNGVVSKARGDNARATRDAAQSAVAAAAADLERARRELGDEGADNPQIREAVAALGEAKLTLEWAELRAPARGVVVDLVVTNGVFARAGSPLLTFASFEEVWVEAYMKENNIANIDIGDSAEIVLDLYPGRIFNGVVASITMGASDGTRDSGLPSTPEVSGWMRDPQRFPVRIAMTGYEVGSEVHDIRRMMNGQADIIVYTGENGFLNALGAAWIRLMSVISYAY